MEFPGKGLDRSTREVRSHKTRSGSDVRECVIMRIGVYYVNRRIKCR